MIDLETITLKQGNHPAPSNGVENACAMEWVHVLDCERRGVDYHVGWTDSPACTCPIIASFVRKLNDRIGDDAMRTRILRPLLPLLLGTGGDRETMVRRAYIAADFAVREAAPIALEARGCPEDAAKLRALDPIVDRDSALKARDAAADADAAAASYAAASYAAASYAAADAAADAAAAAAAAAAARDRVYQLAAACIQRMCEVGRG